MKRVIIFLVIGALGFYRFFTYDRSYTWSKEIREEAMLVANGSGFAFKGEIKSDVKSIKLPIEKLVKIKIQKWLSKVELMGYGDEFGTTILFTSRNSSEVLRYKAWCLSDHVIGLEVEYKNVGDATLIELKRKSSQQFSNYKIIWTDLSD